MSRRLFNLRWFLVLSIVWTVSLQTRGHLNWKTLDTSIEDLMAAGPIIRKQNGTGSGVNNSNVTIETLNHNTSKALEIEEPDIDDFTKNISRAGNTTVVTPHENQKSCTCVKCKEDTLCGRLWEGNIISGDVNGNTNISETDVHLVVSHCKTSLDFIDKLTKGLKIASIHVISKCGYPVNGAPPNTKIQVLPNVGRCDHSYAYYITSVLDQKLQGGRGDDAVVVFLKDTRHASARNLHQPGRWNSIRNMVEVASSGTGFSCGVLPGVSKQYRKYTMSAYFELEILRTLHKKSYVSIAKYRGDNVTFESNLTSWELFYKNLGAGPLEAELVPVCFGGIFAASVRSIKKTKMAVWKAAEESLSRGDNIQEGHYMERMWAMLLSLPLEKYQVEALKKYADLVYRLGYGGNDSLIGALAKKV